MYLVSFEGNEFKARTKTDIFDWLQSNGIDVSFRRLSRVRSVSRCGMWCIVKVDGRTIPYVDWLDNYGLVGDVLVDMGGFTWSPWSPA